MTTYFTTDLDGSGQIVAVADSGLDEDHGDFGTRVVGNNDVIGDGSTADKHSGHGTHVSCTVLGDGAQGGYAGVAPEADLFFQAMENDNTGNFQSPSLNYLLNSAYSAGARTHTNSWGSSQASDQGKYTSSAEDVDDRANYYDRYYNGRDGLTILFAAGNDGPNTGTVGAPATAKNIISVGNHQNRYAGAPDTIMSGSSRGPTDDGRIKPDLIAPGGYVRSCRAQEATDTGSSTWSSTYYLEYTGTSMATPNAAGAATMIREYLEEIAQRPSPQGALVKALMVLGATDLGSRDIPNDNEGWGKVNLRETLAPTSGQGIWVDDRSVLSGSGNSKSYTFNITQSNGGLKIGACVVGRARLNLFIEATGQQPRFGNHRPVWDLSTSAMILRSGQLHHWGLSADTIEQPRSRASRQRQRSESGRSKSRTHSTAGARPSPIRHRSARPRGERPATRPRVPRGCIRDVGVHSASWRPTPTDHEGVQRRQRPGGFLRH